MCQLRCYVVFLIIILKGIIISISITRHLRWPHLNYRGPHMGVPTPRLNNTELDWLLLHIFSIWVLRICEKLGMQNQILFYKILNSFFCFFLSFQKTQNGGRKHVSARICSSTQSVEGHLRADRLCSCECTQTHRPQTGGCREAGRELWILQMCSFF